MGKTNRERVQKVTRKWFEIIGKHKWPCPQWMQDILEGMVLVLVNKAERRGLRKMCCEPAPPFDAEKVRELLDCYASHCYWRGKNGHDFSSIENEKNGYLRDILAALHINEK